MPSPAPRPRPGTGPARNSSNPQALRHLVRVAQVVTQTGSAEQKFRTLRVSGILLALSGIGSVLLVASLGAADAADIVALRVMAYGCWLYGGLGLFYLMSPDALKDEPNELCRIRGHDSHSLFLRGVAFARRLSLGMCLAGLPGLAAALLVSPTVGTTLQRTGLLLVSLFYVVSLSVLLGALGAVSTRAAPRAPRTFALSVILVPFFLSFSFEGVPSIVGIYSWGLGRLISWGAVVS